MEDYSASAVIVTDLSRPGRDYSCMWRLQDFIFPAYDSRFIAINDDVDRVPKRKMILRCSKMYLTTTTPRIPARKSGQWQRCGSKPGNKHLDIPKPDDSLLNELVSKIMADSPAK